MKKQEKIYRKQFTFDGIRYSVTGRTQEELYERVAKKKLELEQGTRKLSGSMLLRDWAKEWLEDYKAPQVSAYWLKSISRIIDNVVVRNLGRQPLRALKPAHIQRLLNEYQGMSQSYISKIYNILHEMMQDAVNNDLIKNNPVDRVTKPKARRKQKRRSITDYEREKVLAVCKRHRGGIFVKIMLYCGLRPGEVAALKWNNIDFESRTLEVCAAIKKDGTIGEPKSEAGFRTIPIPDIFFSELEQLRSSSDQFGFVCTTEYGNRHYDKSIDRMWKSFKRELNIEMGCKLYRNKLVPPLPLAEDLVLYCFRHTYCTDLQAAGVPINVARELMGHSSISITAEIYTHSSQAALSNARDMINRYAERDDERQCERTVSESLK